MIWGLEVCSLKVDTAAADTDHLLLHPPLLIRFTAHKPQYSERTKDRFALALSKSVVPRVIHLLSFAHDVRNVSWEPACIIVTLILRVAHGRRGEC